jgi:hypothetical protein
VSFLWCPIHSTGAVCVWSSPGDLRDHLRRWGTYSSEELDTLVRDAKTLED